MQQPGSEDTFKLEISSGSKYWVGDKFGEICGGTNGGRGNINQEITMPKANMSAILAKYEGMVGAMPVALRWQVSGELDQMLDKIDKAKELTEGLLQDLTAKYGFDPAQAWRALNLQQQLLLTSL
ncbi:hypothetical protein PLEOSDRAFT_1080166 [Pleurotus ostreatus PC15]|uniref:Uncharacterized protein n=1 Tax=Pleurotus ostreatus (strain PC15) TaxID=1137138 RepID=A0A067P845_PLEO1|nr:hypothetical protein PLEOSDRAFT_1080166 [Pleurotus ostreatus PC15]